VDDLIFRVSVSWNNLELDHDVISDGSILFRKGDRPISSPETTAGAGAEYRFGLGSGGFHGRWAVSANYTSSQSYRMVPSLGEPAVIQDGDPMIFVRAHLSIDSPDHWTATLYGDNLNNERGAPVRAFIGVENWDARVRPRTVGVQLDYHLH
jgi:outer membrane receptor protein involved in Fe transport